MPNVTTCTECGGLYEAGSEEQANERVRLCFACRAPNETALRELLRVSKLAHAPHVFHGFYIPSRMMGGIRRYVDEGVEPGDFLCAVIANDLKEAVGRADDENMANLPAFVDFFYNHAPSLCWGSSERMAKWIEAKHADRQAATSDAKC